jgi:hypothetical protein
VGGNNLESVTNLRLSEVDNQTLVIDLNYNFGTVINQLGSDPCFVENLYSSYKLPDPKILPFAKKISGKVKINLSKQQLLNLKSDPKDLMVVKRADFNSDDKNLLNRCNQTILNSIKNDNLTLKVFYNKDTRIKDGYVKVAGFYIPLRNIIFSKDAQEIWDKTVQNYSYGDILEIQGDFSTKTDKPFSFIPQFNQTMEINLDYITSLAKVGNDNADKVDFGGRIFFDLARTKAYYEGYDTSSFRDYIQNITIIALDSNNNEVARTQTDSNGHFQFYVLPTGKYTFNVDKNTIKTPYKNFSIDRGVEYGGVEGLSREIYLNGSNKSVEMPNTFWLHFLL